MNGKNIALSLLLVAFVSSLWVAVQKTQQYRSQVKLDRDHSYQQAEAQSRLLADSLNTAMQQQVSAADELAAKLNEGTIEYSAVDVEIRMTLRRYKDLYGLSVSFAPYMYDRKIRLYGPYYRRIKGKLTFSQVEDSYEYTVPSDATIWYTESKAKGEPGWYAIYSRINFVRVIDYSVPFYKTDPVTGKRVFAGVVTATNSFGSNLGNIIHNTELGEEGYASVQSDKGVVIHYPNLDLTGLPVSEVMDGFDASTLTSNLKRAVDGDFVQADGPSNKNGTVTWAFFQPLHATGWTLITIVPQDFVVMEKETKIRLLIDIGLLYALSAGLAFLLLLRLDLTTERRVWATSVGTAFILLFTILWIWYVIYTNPTRNGEQKAIVNDARINERLEKLDTFLKERNIAPAVRIPTGIMIQNMALTNKSTTLSGYLWQKYPAGTVVEKIEPPQFVDQISGGILRKRYEISETGGIVVGWFFTVEIRQYFDVSKYPLDRAVVRIQLEPTALDKNYVLVPDVDAYEMIGPAQKPGLSTHLLIPGWNVMGSYFSFRDDEYNVNFGDSRILHKELVPVLSFNVLATRNIVFPIVTYCILIYVVVVQAFGISVLKLDDPFQVLSVSAALFLVVAITHNSLRNELASNGAIYLEYYFILLYLAILASSVTALLRASKSTFFLIHYRDNILTKTLFWPSYLGTSLIITLILFHPGIKAFLATFLR